MVWNHLQTPPFPFAGDGSGTKAFLDTLIKLTNYEIDVREQNMIHAMVKVAAFPYLKKIKDFNFDFQPNIN
ncbi:hypothetical protein LSPCS325_40560 [Lysinibacillus sp. CTST325]